MKIKKDDLNKKYGYILWGILTAGILLRLVYVLATPVIQTRQYDLGSAVPEEGIFTGHLGYIFYLFTNKGLPDFDPREVYQFFHPPLHHILSALWMGVVSLFTDNRNLWIEWLQALPFLYSVLILWVILQICKEFKLQGRGLLFVMTVTAFHPSLIFIAGSINNDGLALLFQFLTIWFALRWYHKRSYGNILGIALSIGFGMISKLSVGLFAVPVAFLFLYVLVTEWKEKPAWGRLLQYVVFGAVCIPIGLSWAVRCLLKFDMPLTYVNHLPEQSWQYVGNYSFVQRFFPPDPIGLFRNLSHGSLGFGENVWMQLFRTAALGECDLGEFPLWGKLVALVMMFLAFVLAIWCFVLLIRVFVAGKKANYPVMDGGIRFFWLIGYGALLYSYLNFCYNFPHQCTMNFRYMVPTILYPAVAAGLAMQRAVQAGSEKPKNPRWVRLLELCTAAYAAVSVCTVILWCITV